MLVCNISLNFRFNSSQSLTLSLFRYKQVKVLTFLTICWKLYIKFGYPVQFFFLSLLRNTWLPAYDCDYYLTFCSLLVRHKKIMYENSDPFSERPLCYCGVRVYLRNFWTYQNFDRRWHDCVTITSIFDIFKIYLSCIIPVIVKFSFVLILKCAFVEEE